MSTAPLLELLARRDAVSGAELARTLGVTRAAVWKQIERLRALGLPIEAAAGIGYRLAQPVELLDATRIRAALPPAARALVAALDVELEIDSTSSALVRRGASAPSGSVLLAETQSAGRGRRGRAWSSPLACHLYASVLWRFDAGYAALSGLSLAIGVAITRALRGLDVAELGLKWPNDVLGGGAKLGGILIDLNGESAGPCVAVVGIGVNGRMPPAAAAAIDQPWTDLATLCAGAPPSRNAVAAAVVGATLLALQRFAHDGLASFLDDWRAFDALAGRVVRVEGSASIEGTAAGIDADGHLLVDTPHGRVRVASGEVSVRAQR